MAHHTSPKTNMPQSLEKTSHVFVRTDAVRAPLVRPHTGPYEVLSKSDKFFKISKNGKTDNVTIDRLKPAFLQQQTKTNDVIGEEAANSKHTGVRLEPVVPGQRRARGRPRKERKHERLRESDSSEEKTENVIHDTQRTRFFTTRSGRISRPCCS